MTSACYIEFLLLDFCSFKLTRKNYWCPPIEVNRAYEKDNVGNCWTVLQWPSYFVNSIFPKWDESFVELSFKFHKGSHIASISVVEVLRAIASQSGGACMSYVRARTGLYRVN
ncbi:unnamed protein product [Ilex paraguariensis]|uniref:Uncharacterized protein n=1 Tax=Ilex paraguariensis TaxID=185542 RepID=A0ABC8UV09_9AQUA